MDVKLTVFHFSVLQHDLKPFKRGVSADLLASTVQRGVGTHYQIIGHNLYRENNCMFPARFVKKNAPGWC